MVPFPEKGLENLFHGNLRNKELMKTFSCEITNPWFCNKPATRVVDDGKTLCCEDCFNARSIGIKIQGNQSNQSVAGSEHDMILVEGPNKLESGVSPDLVLSNDIRGLKFNEDYGSGKITVQVPRFGNLLKSITFTASEMESVELWYNAEMISQRIFTNEVRREHGTIAKAQCVFNGQGFSLDAPLDSKVSEKYKTLEIVIRGHGMQSVVGDFINLSKEGRDLLADGRITLASTHGRFYFDINYDVDSEIPMPLVDSTYVDQIEVPNVPEFYGTITPTDDQKIKKIYIRFGTSNVEEILLRLADMISSLDERLLETNQSTTRRLGRLECLQHNLKESFNDF